VLAKTPFGAPIWVDDPHFNIEYHVRHTSLPHPGDDAQLKALCGRVFSQPMDRKRPLWEIWIVEGLAGGDQFAFVSKNHHAMVDGVSAVNALEVLLRTEPVTDFEPAKPWKPQPPPWWGKLAVDDLTSAVGGAADMLRHAPAVIADVFRPHSEVRASLRGLADLTFKTIRRPTQTPLNQLIGPHRRFDWLSLDLNEIKAIRRACGNCSGNDVVLATVAGAVRRFLEHRGVDAGHTTFRVMAPVSVRPPEARGALGNRVAAWMVPLPIGEIDPRKRLEIVHETTRKLKEEKNALGSELLNEMASWTPSAVLFAMPHLSWWNLPFNLVVTNVPGPAQPVYLLGSKMIMDYGLVPLAEYTGLGIVLFSYDGQLSWGFNADWDLMPDLDVFARYVKAAFRELRDATRPAEVTTKAPEVRP
jgi:WS/DGAT/MGAT family acyltransferase